MLISAVMPIMSIYHLPLGQYGYTGHVINLPQDVVSFALSLPRLPSELDVLVVRKNSEQSHRDFHVRRSVVQQALTWLLNNNRYYQANAVHINEEALQQLPEDGDLSNLTSLPMSNLQSESLQDDLYGAHLSTSFVPNATQQRTEHAQLTVDELQDMVGIEGESFSNRVLHYASSLRGTRQYWFKQRGRLISMVDTLGLPTIFFTHSAADLQWPELAQLICPEDSNTSRSRIKAVNNNPALADWFFYHRVQKFVDAFYLGVLKATDYWLRFEWQHRGSPHVHGVAWLPNAPDVEQLLKDSENAEALKQDIIQYANRLVSTINPAVAPDGSDVESAPQPVTQPHICNKSYLEVADRQEDLSQLIATCQRHTRCSEAYCLRTNHGKQVCRFGYPKLLQPETTVVTEDEPTLLTARNDGMLNSFNPVQLSAWRANVDMQYIVSRRRVIDYCTKYVTKSEPRSESLKDTFAKIVRSLKDDNRSLKAVQKLLIHTIGDRDYSAQETCHILLQLPMYKCSRDFIVLSLDGSRAVEDCVQDDGRVTAPSTLDHYLVRPATPVFNKMTLLEFTQSYTIPKELGAAPNKRNKKVVVITRPYCSPDPAGPKYEQYCQQSLMKHKNFHQFTDLLAGHETYAQAYAEFLQTGDIPSSLDEDIFRLQQHQQQANADEVNVYMYMYVHVHVHLCVHVKSCL